MRRSEAYRRGKQDAAKTVLTAWISEEGATPAVMHLMRHYGFRYWHGMIITDTEIKEKTDGNSNEEVQV